MDTWTWERSWQRAFDDEQYAFCYDEQQHDPQHKPPREALTLNIAQAGLAKTPLALGQQQDRWPCKATPGCV